MGTIRISRYTDYKKWAMLKAKDKGIIFNFTKIDDRVYYIYRVTDLVTNIHYYGSRVAKTLDIGIKYFTSSSIVKPLLQLYPSRFKIKIVKIFDNSKDKELYESFLHQYHNCLSNPKFYNRANQTPFGHDTTGMVSVIDVKTNTSFLTSIQNFNGNKDLVASSKNRVTSTSTRKKLSITSKYMWDNRSEQDIKKHAEIMSNHKSNFWKNKDDLYIKEFGGKISKAKTGMVNCKDLLGNSLFVTKEEFHSRNDLFGMKKGKCNTPEQIAKQKAFMKARNTKWCVIFDENSNEMYRFDKNCGFSKFKDFCVSVNIPHDLFRYYLQKQIPVLPTIRKSNKSKYVGWYVKAL